MRYLGESDNPREIGPSPNSASPMPALEADVAIAEVLLLLTVYQARALEEAAHPCDLTVSQMVCNLIQDFLDRKGRLLCQR